MDIDLGRDKVCIDGVELKPQDQKVYLMLNKPAGVLCTCHDDRGRKTVLDIVGGFDERLFPVGRLDYDTEGLLLLTNDGEFAYKCTHPSHELEKTYYAVAADPLDDRTISLLRNGVEIDGQITSKAKVNVLKRSADKTELEITIHEGRNRQIRRMLVAVGSRVVYLKRKAIGRLTIGNLEVGKWRALTEKDFMLLGIFISEDKQDNKK
jgi:pseudouridine synthase